MPIGVDEFRDALTFISGLALSMGVSMPPLVTLRYFTGLYMPRRLSFQARPVAA